MKLAVPGLAALVAAGMASAQQPSQPDWLRVNGDERVTAYVDRASVRREGDLIRFAGRIVYVEPDQDGVKELLHFGEISCARRDYRIIRFDALDSSGGVIATHVSEEAATAINEGSPNATLHAEHCG